MPCRTRMKIILLQGLLWLYLYGLGFAVSTLEPGFLDFDNLPDTNFSCVGKVIGGYYADLETSCQMFHVCTIGQLDEPMDIRFLCLNGTVFDQETRVCERIDEVDCSKSEQFYSLNLELYGNTQPPILEDVPETEVPEILKKASTTTTTTTTPRSIKPKTTRPNFIITTTSKPPTTTTLADRFLQSHHFPVSQSADIRFNPEEINISLNPGAPPNIRPKPLSFQQSISDNNKHVIVTTHTTIYKNENKPIISTSNPSQISIHEVNNPKPNYGISHEQQLPRLQTPVGGSYSYNAYHTEKSIEYGTEHSKPEVPFRPNTGSFRPTNRDIEHYTPRTEYKPSTYKATYHPTTLTPIKITYNRGPTTYRNAYSSPLKPSLPYYHRTDKPPRIQLPLPLVPTLSPLTFSSPAPFSLNRHVESKRFTDHHQPPRIVISASASVSDASGRKFNYSLGTIGDSRFFSQTPPHSYDDYKDDETSLDPFYHDVPKLKRAKRETDETKKILSSITNDKEALEVLKFLFNWYNSQEKPKNVEIPIKSDTITEINRELSTTTTNKDYIYDDYDYSTAFNKNTAKPVLLDKVTKDENINYVKEPIMAKRISKDDYAEEFEPKINTENPSTVEKILKEENIDYVDEPKTNKNANEVLKYNVSAGVVVATESPIKHTIIQDNTKYTTTELPMYEYVDDNYEPITYNDSGKVLKTLEFGNDDNYEPITYQNSGQVNRTLHFRIGFNVYTTDPPEMSETVTPSTTTVPPTTTKTTTISDLPLFSEHYERINIYPTEERDPTPTTTENYDKVLKILGITTSQPLRKQKNRKRQRGNRVYTPPFLDFTRKPTTENYQDVKVPKRSRGRGRKRFGDEIDQNLSSSLIDSRKTNTYELRETESKRREATYKEFTNYSYDYSSGQQTPIPDYAVSGADNLAEDYTVLESQTTTPHVTMSETQSSFFDYTATEGIPSDFTIIENSENTEITSSPVDSTITTENNPNDIVTENSEITTTDDRKLSKSKKYYNTEKYKITDRFTDWFSLTTDLTAEPSTEMPTSTENSWSTNHYLTTLQNNENYKTTKDAESTTDTPSVTMQNQSTDYPSTMQETITTIYTSTESISTDTTTTSSATLPSTINVETTTDAPDYKTIFTSTANSLYTTVQLQKFIQEIESNTKSIADVKGITDTTIEITTVKDDISTNNETKPIPTTTEETITVEKKSRRRNKNRGGHRFSAPETPKGQRRKPSITEQIVDVIKHRMDEEVNTKDTLGRKKIEFNINAYTANLAYRDRSGIVTEEMSVTDPSFSKSANPTLAKQPKDYLTTTPLSKTAKAVNVRRQEAHRAYVFNCIGKELNRFHSDPRDCRLFHYCTKGFTKTQFLDMKFVCDQGTYFDVEKLICTNVKPLSCT